jgi:zinc/manganese transport system substrate-binding protein
MKRLLFLFALCLPLPLHAALNVFACEPEWAALARELGGSDVKVYAATTALQDPHRIEARPSLIAQMRRADLVVCTGAELEAGWLPLLLRDSGNARVQPGRPGYFEATQFVELLEKPARVDRSGGDVHAAGNPHIHTDPRNIARVAAALSARLAEIDPAHAGAHRSRGADFAVRWQTAIDAWQRKAAPLRDVPVAVHHKSFSYLLAWLGMREVAMLEPKPGIEPSVAQLSRISAQLQTTPARMVLRAAYHSPRPAEWLAQRNGIPVVVLPYTVGGNAAAIDLFGLFDDTVERLLRAMQ